MKPDRGSGFPLEPVIVALTAIACLVLASGRLTG